MVCFEVLDFGFRLLDTIHRVDGSITMAVCCTTVQWSGFESQLPTFKIMFISLILAILVVNSPHNLQVVWKDFMAEGINALKNSTF